MRTARLCLLPLITAWTAECSAQEAAGNAGAADALRPVVVTATRSEQSGFDLPASIDRIDSDAIRQGNPMVNLSETLPRAPGVVAQNRQNYAQDLQISIRGFGARSTFGVRGVRLYADGIPATMPDGQGQTSNIDLAAAGRIEVLRGPFSALYGNSSGGVIAVFTEEGKPGLQLSSFARAGSYGSSHVGFKASGQQGALNYVIDASRFDTGGYREHSAAARTLANAKLRMTTDADAAVTLIANSVSMPEAQDPLGLSRSQWQADPRGVAANALLFNTRKSVSQQQLGLSYEKILDRENSLRAMLYAGTRATTQFQAIPVAAQSTPTSAGGVIDLARRYGGADLRWTRRQEVEAGSLQWSAGVAIDTLEEDRRGFENFIGSTLGVQGNLRRDERNRVYNIDEYAQAQWEPDGRWVLLAGVRNSRVRVRSDDRYIAPGNGDDSGGVGYRALTPVLGATYKLSQAVNLYASYGRGFETPTLNELSYRPDGGGFNFALQPSKSNNFEAGVKAVIGPHLRANFAAFHIDTANELSVLSNSGGRAVFQNAGRTRRDGIEWSLEGNWPNGVAVLLSASALRAVYADGFCCSASAPSAPIAAGNRIPGVLARQAYTELSWRHAASGFSAALEGKYVGKVYVDDLNSDAAPAYFIAGIRAGFEQRSGPWRMSEFVRIDNLANREYGGSVIVNESNQRFFEPAPGRNYLAGVSIAYAW